MISKMAFGVRQVRDFLAYNGYVLTVRGYDYKTTSAIVPELDGIQITRKKVCEITTIDDLDGFVPLSGFKTASEWWVQIRRFCKGRMWLYRVQIDDGHISKIERDYEKIEQQRMFAEQNAWSNEEEIAEIIAENYRERGDEEPISKILTHPFDVQENLREFHDSFMIDLQPHKDAVHEARIQREARQAERRRERMREWEAETVSFVFCEKFGIDNKAPQYLKEWGATRDNIKASLGTISKVSSQIIKAVEVV